MEPTPTSHVSQRRNYSRHARRSLRGHFLYLQTCSLVWDPRPQEFKNLDGDTLTSDGTQGFASRRIAVGQARGAAGVLPANTEVCGVHGPPHPAHLAARRPRLRAGRRGRGGSQQGGAPGWPGSPRLDPRPQKSSPRARALGPPNPESAGLLTDLGSQAPGSLTPRAPLPRTPPPLWPPRTRRPVWGGLPEAQAPPPAFTVAVSAPGRPTQPGQRGDSAERCTVRDRSSSSAPAGPRRKLPLAPPTRRSLRRLDLVRGQAGTGPRAIGKGGRPSPRPGPPPRRRLPSGGSAGRRRAGQRGPYCCCVIGVRRRPLAATPGTAGQTRAGQRGDGLRDGPWRGGVSQGHCRGWAPKRKGSGHGLRGAGILGRGAGFGSSGE